MRIFRPRAVALLIAVACPLAPAQERRPPLTIVADVKSKAASPFHLDLASYPAARRPLPVGVFDSGTGGLTVLDAILHLDEFTNGALEATPDGVPDLASEAFVYLGDAANMPYGRYPAEGQVDLLREHVVKDAWFLLARSYHESPRDRVPHGTKEPVKAIVIACNTATAYGLEDVRRALAAWGLDLGVIGVIDAGAAAAVARLPAVGKGVAIGVMATEGTCASMGYPRAVRAHFRRRFGHDDLVVVQQAGVGLAGAIDGDPSYLDPAARQPRGPKRYQGPALGHPTSPIDLALWQRYRFDTGANHLLVRADPDGRRRAVELNSVENYVRYHVTSLVEKALARAPGRRLEAVILGCTHYPFFAREIEAQLRSLRGLDARHARLLPEHVAIIDPARCTARQLYRHLAKRHLLGPRQTPAAGFYISVPNPRLPRNRLDEHGRFPYAYKYGREPGQDVLFVKRVPFSKAWIPAATVARLRRRLPRVYNLMCEFHRRKTFRHHPPEVLFRKVEHD